MKSKLKISLFPTKTQAIQGRSNLPRIRNDFKRQSLRIVLSPTPYPPVKSPRKSITKFSPRRSIVLRRSMFQDGSKISDQLKEKFLTPKNKKQRKCTKRKNEAEKLREDLLSNKSIIDGNFCGSRRALRSGLILTSKSPLVRVKKITRRNAISRKISLNSLNKYLNRDVRIELEKLRTNEEPLEINPSQIEDSETVLENESDQIIRLSRKKIPSREITILLEKLSPSVTQPYVSKKPDQVPSTSLVQSEVNELFSEFTTNDAQTREVFKRSKHGPILDVRIVLEKLPDTDSISVTKTSLVELGKKEVEIQNIEDLSRDVSLETLTEVCEKIDNACNDDHSTKEPHEEPSTPTRETLSEQMPISVIPTVSSKSSSTTVGTPESGTFEHAEMNSKKTPKSLNIPLRQIIIVKSKLTKINRVLGSPNKISPIKVQPTSTYLSSPFPESKHSKQNKSSTQDTDSVTCLESSTADIVSSSDSIFENSTYDDSSQFNTSSSTSSVSSPILESRSYAESAGISSPTISTASKKIHIKPVYMRKTLLETSNWISGMGKLTTASLNKKTVEEVKEVSKTTATTFEKTQSPQSSVETPPSVPFVPKSTEVKSPLSRGELLTAKSLAASPNAPKMILGKSPSQLVHSSKSDGCKKTHAKSPLRRGRLLTEQSLAASPKHQNLDIVGKASSLLRCHSSVSSSSRERQDVSCEQKWNLLKSSSIDTESNSSAELSPVATPLDPSSVSTLKSANRNKSELQSGKLPQWSIKDITKPLNISSKKTQDLIKIRTQNDKSSEKQTEGLIEPTEKSYATVSQPTRLPSTQKKPFQIPKIKSGVSNFHKTFSASPSNLPRSGFTPSPPTKSSVTRPVLDKIYNFTSCTVTANYRQPPPKSSQSCSYKSWTKPSATTSCFKTSTRKPFYSTSSHSSTIKTTSTLATQTSSSGSNTSSTISKPSQISRSQPLTKPLHTSSSHLSPFKTPYPVASHPSSTKSSYIANSHSMTAKPQYSTNSQTPFAKPAPLSLTPPTKPSYVPSSQPTPRTSETRSFIPTPTKSHLLTKSITKPKSPKSKSKFRPFKTAYMSSRSSNTTSFSKCLPSGPQYSPTYSKFLQDGFSRLPAAQYKIPKPARPVSPGTSNVLRWSIEKPWMSNKSASPPIGPSNSLTSSTLALNPSYSPLCPNFDE